MLFSTDASTTIGRVKTAYNTMVAENDPDSENTTIAVDCHQTINKTARGPQRISTNSVIEIQILARVTPVTPDR